jgi:DNA-binding transcriptional LysR family regulator
MISTMVYHGLGVAVVPRRCVQAPNPVTVKEIAITNLESRPVGILVRHDSPKTNLIEALCTQMLHVVKHLGSPAPSEEGAKLRQSRPDPGIIPPAP